MLSADDRRPLWEPCGFGGERGERHVFGRREQPWCRRRFANDGGSFELRAFRFSELCHASPSVDPTCPSFRKSQGIADSALLERVHQVPNHFLEVHAVKLSSTLPRAHLGSKPLSRDRFRRSPRGGIAARRHKRSQKSEPVRCVRFSLRILAPLRGHSIRFIPQTRDAEP